MSKFEKISRMIDKVLSSSSTVSKEEIVKYQDDLDEYYAASYELASETC